MTSALMLALFPAGGTHRAGLGGGLCCPVEAADAGAAGGLGQAPTH